MSEKARCNSCGDDKGQGIDCMTCLQFLWDQADALILENQQLKAEVALLHERITMGYKQIKELNRTLEAQESENLALKYED